MDEAQASNRNGPCLSVTPVQTSPQEAAKKKLAWLRFSTQAGGEESNFYPVYLHTDFIDGFCHAQPRAIQPASSMEKLLRLVCSGLS